MEGVVIFIVTVVLRGVRVGLKKRLECSVYWKNELIKHATKRREGGGGGGEDSIIWFHGKKHTICNKLA